MRPATQILVPNNKSAPVNKKNARALLEDGIFSRFERKLLTEEESKAKAQAPKMEAPLDAFLGSSCVARWEVHRLLLQKVWDMLLCLDFTGLNHNKPLWKVILNRKQPPKSQHVVLLRLPVKLQRSMDLWLSIS